MQSNGYQEKTSSDKRCYSCELLGATLGILTSYLHKSQYILKKKKQSKVSKHI